MTQQDRPTRRASAVGLALVPLALAACHSQPSVEAKNETPQAVASKVAASGIRLDPGRWEATSQVEKIDMPGITPQVREMMNKSMSKTSFASCLTPAQAAKPEAGFFQNKGDNCKFNSFSMENGKIDGVLVCSGAQQKQTMTMSGTYSPDAYSMHIEINGDTPRGAMSMAVSTSAKQVGKCRGNEDS